MRKALFALAVVTLSATLTPAARADQPVPPSPAPVATTPAAETANQKVQKLFDVYCKLRDGKQLDEAIKVLDDILVIDPTNTYVWSEGAWIANERNQFAVAVQAAEKALECNPDNSDGWRELGYALMKLKRHSDATKALAAAVQKNPKNWFAYDYLAENYESVGQFTLARQVRDKKASEKAKVAPPQSAA
jgi:predicted Zn-dependent protease